MRKRAADDRTNWPRFNSYGCRGGGEERCNCGARSGNDTGAEALEAIELIVAIISKCVGPKMNPDSDFGCFAVTLCNGLRIVSRTQYYR